MSNTADLIDLTVDTDYVVLAENMDVLPVLPDGAFQLIYIDPPFNRQGARTEDVDNNNLRQRRPHRVWWASVRHN